MKLRRRETGAETPLTEGMLVGRLPQCGLLINENSVSRKHAVVEQRGAGWWLKDLGSSNGMACNGRKLTEFELRHGDLITFGNIAFDVIAPAPVAENLDEIVVEGSYEPELSMPPPKSVEDAETSAPSRADIERARLRREAKGAGRARGLGDLSQQPAWILVVLFVAGGGVLYGVGMGVRWLMNTISGAG
jgi:predicted component of type VI protein secretion system